MQEYKQKIEITIIAEDRTEFKKILKSAKNKLYKDIRIESIRTNKLICPIIRNI